MCEGRALGFELEAQVSRRDFQLTKDTQADTHHSAYFGTAQRTTPECTVYFRIVIISTHYRTYFSVITPTESAF